MILIFLSALLSTTSKAQTISDSEFSWIRNEDCLPKGINKEEFVKVEQDPVLTQFNKSEFDHLFKNIMNECRFDKALNGILKLKILFAKGQNLCIAQTGTKSIQLTTIQTDKISKRLNEIQEFESGKQRSIKVDCIGIFYVELANGKLLKTRNVNFNFRFLKRNY